MKSGSLGRPPKPAVAAASSSVSGKTFYWRGFVSDMGLRQPTRCPQG
jgi:hypothetical protein